MTKDYPITIDRDDNIAMTQQQHGGTCGTIRKQQRGITQPQQHSMTQQCRTIQKQRRGMWTPRRLALPILCMALSVLLSGCSVAGIDLTTSPTSPTPVTTAGVVAQNAAARATSQAQPTPAFDNAAGNCPDAAAQAIDLMNYAQQHSLTFDMQVSLNPAGGCGSTDAARLSQFRNRVTLVNLNAYVLDATWSQAYTTDRTAFLDDLMARLHGLYPAATVSVNVYYNMVSVASGQLGADNVPHVQCCSG